MIEDNPDAQRRSQLQAAKLKAIVRDRLGLAPDDASLADASTLSVPDGAGIVLSDGGGDAGAEAPHVYFVTGADSGLGAMLLLAEREGADAITIFGDVALDNLARQANNFDLDIEVLNLQGREPVTAAPGVVAEEAVAPAEVVMALEGSADDDVMVVVEHGEAVAEVAGLEIARASMDAGQLIVRVGVGWADQELAAMIEPGVASVDRIRAAAALVRQHRQPDVAPHPLQRVAAERWLRSRLLGDPNRWGLAALRPVSLLEPRVGLRLSAPAAAAGSRVDGTPVLVVTSVGVNPELAVVASDLHQARYPDAELILAMPEADSHAAILRLAAQLKSPPTMLTTPPVTHRWPA